MINKPVNVSTPFMINNSEPIRLVAGHSQISVAYARVEFLVLGVKAISLVGPAPALGSSPQALDGFCHRQIEEQGTIRCESFRCQLDNLRNQLLGKAPTRAVQRITAVNLAPHDAHLLHLPDGAAVLRIDRTAYLPTGRPIEFTRGLYRSDIYDFIAELRLEPKP